jgi:hypothetical protein
VSRGGRGVLGRFDDGEVVPGREGASYEAHLVGDV